MNEEKRKLFLEIISSNPERTAIMRRYARDRRIKLLHKRHTSKFGLSYLETKLFADFLKNNGAVEDVVAPQKLEKQEKEDNLQIFSRGPRIKTLEQLLKNAEVDLSKWGVDSWKANTWEVCAKNASGEIQVTPVWQIKASLVRQRLLEAQPVPAHEIIRKEPNKPRRDQVMRAMFIPDSQHGYKWNAPDFDYLEPLHDRVAFDAACEFAGAFQPDAIVLLGDMLDLAPFSSFPTDPTTRQTTQPALAELHWQIKQLRKKCPRATIHYIGGNHEIRLKKQTMQKMEELTYLRDATSKKGSDSIISIPRLLRLDALDVEWLGDYDNDWWLWNRIRVYHGRMYRGGVGATTQARIKSATHSEVFGHIHKFELAQKTVFGPKGSRAISIMTPGCLCRIDGSVPGVSKIPDWQQGIGIAYVDLENDHDHLSLVPIHDGNLFFDGRRFLGQDRSEEIAQETGFKQLVRQDT